MIPVHVREQTRPAERSALIATSTEIPKSGSEIENQLIFAGCDETHARRVTAVPSRVIPMARSRTPNAVERDCKVA